MANNNSYNPEFNSYNSTQAGGATTSPTLLLDNLIWMSTKEAALYLRRSVNSIHILVSRGQLKARKFSNRLYFKRDELDYLIETSFIKGG